MTEQDELNRLRVAEQIREALAEILGNQHGIKAGLERLEDQCQRVEEQVNKTNGRVTALEIWQAKSSGVWAAITAGAGVASYVIGWALGLWKEK
jgi:hypothetical protein